MCNCSILASVELLCLRKQHCCESMIRVITSLCALCLLIQPANISLVKEYNINMYNYWYWQVNIYAFQLQFKKFLLLVMELWRLRAREFLSARSTHDSREDEREESLAEALSSPNSAPMNWRQDKDRDKGETTLSDGDGALGRNRSDVLSSQSVTCSSSRGTLGLTARIRSGVASLSSPMFS